MKEMNSEIGAEFAKLIPFPFSFFFFFFFCFFFFFFFGYGSINSPRSRSQCCEKVTKDVDLRFASDVKFRVTCNFHSRG
jgi:hypothetical protein